MSLSYADPIAEAAERLLLARARQQTLVDLPPVCQPETAADAYAIQDRVAAKLWSDAPITAWKTGAPDPTAEPIAAPIGKPLLHASGVRLPSTDFHMLGIEGELAYCFSQDLPPMADGYDAAQIRSAIASIQAVIEIVDSRFSHWQTAAALSKLADFQSNGGLVIGAGRSDWQAIDPLRQRAILRINGATVADTLGGNAAGDPLRLLVWLADHCAARCGGLKAGDIVTTGTCTGLVFVEPGADVSVEFPGLGAVQVAFD